MSEHRCSKHARRLTRRSRPPTPPAAPLVKLLQRADRLTLAPKVHEHLPPPVSPLPCRVDVVRRNPALLVLAPRLRPRGRPPRTGRVGSIVGPAGVPLLTLSAIKSSIDAEPPQPGSPDPNPPSPTSPAAPPASLPAPSAEMAEAQPGTSAPLAPPDHHAPLDRPQPLISHPPPADRRPSAAAPHWWGGRPPAGARRNCSSTRTTRRCRRHRTSRWCCRNWRSGRRRRSRPRLGTRRRHRTGHARHGTLPHIRRPRGPRRPLLRTNLLLSAQLKTCCHDQPRVTGYTLGPNGRHTNAGALPVRPVGPPAGAPDRPGVSRTEYLTPYFPFPKHHPPPPSVQNQSELFWAGFGQRGTGQDGQGFGGTR